jgi:hypothetical protein
MGCHRVEAIDGCLLQTREVYAQYKASGMSRKFRGERTAEGGLTDGREALHPEDCGTPQQAWEKAL